MRWRWVAQAPHGQTTPPRRSDVNAAGRRVRVIVETHNRRKYLKTEADGYAPNNLLALPECP